MTAVLFSLMISISYGRGECPQTVKQNQSVFAWNVDDTKQMKRSQKRCGELYKNSPCLTTFIKTGMNDYKAICGEKR